MESTLKGLRELSKARDDYFDAIVMAFDQHALYFIEKCVPLYNVPILRKIAFCRSRPPSKTAGCIQVAMAMVNLHRGGIKTRFTAPSVASLVAKVQTRTTKRV